VFAMNLYVYSEVGFWKASRIKAFGYVRVAALSYDLLAQAPNCRKGERAARPEIKGSWDECL